MIHMDGQTPSGFTDSTYKGMNANPSTFSSGPNSGGGTGGNGGTTTPPATSGSTEVKKEVKSLANLIEQADGIKEFFSLLQENPWVLFVWFNFW